MSITEPNPRQSARRAVAALAILATIALLLANGTTAAAETPQILSGRYDSYYRAAETGQILQNTRRLVVIDVLKLGIKVTSYLDGKLLPRIKLPQRHTPEQDATGEHDAPKENEGSYDEDEPKIFDFWINFYTVRA